MNKKVTIGISTIFNTICDFSLDIAVNKYNIYSVLLYTSIISFLFQVLYAMYAGISITISAIPVILLYGFIILLGYIFFLLALKNIPIGLSALLENSDLFFVLLIDIIVGNITPTPQFILLFVLFISSILWFILETNKVKNKISFKKVKLIGVFLILLSVLCYTTEPYLIKLANYLGANEVAINFGYSAVAIPFFFFKNKTNKKTKDKNRKFIFLILLIGLSEAIYYILGTIGYMYETPIIANIIQELRVFLLVILSVIFKTDIMNFKKFIAILLGMISILGICIIN